MNRNKLIAFGLLVILLPLSMATPVAGATANGGWGAPMEMDVTSLPYQASDVVTASGPGGAFAVAWIQSDGSIARLWVRIYYPDSGWTAPRAFTGEGYDTSDPAIVIAPNGNVSVFWSEYELWYGFNIIWTVTYEPGAGWTDPSVIHNQPYGSMVNPSVVADHNGNLFVVWHETNGTQINVTAARWTPAGYWGPPSFLDNQRAGPGTVALSVDGAGNAIAVWTQFDSSFTNTYANRYSIGSGWGGTPTVLDSATYVCYSPSVASDSAGNAIAVWYQSNGTRNLIYQAEFAVSSGWGAAQVLSSDTQGHALSPRVAFDSMENALVAWRQTNASGYNGVWTAAYSAGMGWSTPSLLRWTDGGDQYEPRVAFDASGNAWVAWYAYENGAYHVYSQQLKSDGTWGPLYKLDTPGNGGYGVTVQVQSGGEALVTWYADDGFVQSFWGAMYAVPDMTPPAVAITSPTAGSAGTTSPLTVSGTAEVGSDVVVNGLAVDVAANGTWWVSLPLSPGNNSIMVTAEDAAGNSASSSVTVWYTDPATFIQENLTAAQAALASTQSQLATTQSQLATANAQLASTRSDLTATQTDLAGTKASLNTTRGELSTANTNVAGAQSSATLGMVLGLVGILVGVVAMVMVMGMRGKSGAGKPSSPPVEPPK